jgi:hypothetical protein
MISRKLFFVLYIISVWAFLKYVPASNTTFNNIFEVFLILIVFLNVNKIHSKVLPLFLISTSYFFLSLIYVLIFKDAHILDFLLIYKFFIYAMFLSIVFGKKILPKDMFYNFYRFLFILFIIKYIIGFAQGRHRPVLFFENNFELMLVSLLFYLYNDLKGKVSALHQGFLILIFILSKSISGLLILSFVLIMVNKKYIVRKFYIILPSAIMVFMAGLYVIKDRLNGQLDFTQNSRFKFLNAFLNEIQDWNFFNYLFGAPRISQLSNEVCSKLGYWQSLFSYSGDGSCYSVIFHSYILRAVFDHGFLGVIFIFYFVYSILKRAGYSHNTGLTVLGIIVINGLSVSSFNSVYFAIGILFYLVIDKEHNVYSDNRL